MLQKTLLDDGTVLILTKDSQVVFLVAYERDGAYRCASEVLCSIADLGFVIPSPSCREVLVLVRASRSNAALRNRLVALDAKTLVQKQLGFVFPRSGVVLTDAALSRDGKLLALAAFDRTWCIAFVDLFQRHDPGSTALDVEIAPQLWRSTPRCLTFAPDADKLLFRLDTSVVLLSVPLMRVIVKFDLPACPGALHFVADRDCDSGRLLACSLSREEAKVVVVDVLKNGEVVADAGLGGVDVMAVDKRGIIHCAVRSGGQNTLHRFALE
jgi:hypothetical protein